MFTFLLLGLVIQYSTQNGGNSSSSSIPQFPWNENMVEMAFGGANSSRLAEFLHSNQTEIPTDLKPFINETALLEFRKKNETEDWIIRDEDVAEEEEEQYPNLNKAYIDGDKTIVNISPEAGEQLYQHWVDQAVSGLMAAVATNRLEDLADEHKKGHHSCTKTAKTVTAHAKCVVQLMDTKPVIKVPRKSFYQQMDDNKQARIDLLRKKHNIYANPTFKKPIKKNVEVKKSYTKIRKNESEESEGKWVGSFRFKRDTNRVKRWIVTNRKSYHLKEQKKKSLLGDIANKLTKTVRAFKNKGDGNFEWQATMDDIMVEAKRLQKIEKVKKMLQKRIETFGQIAQDMGLESNPGLKAFDFVTDDEPLVKSKEEQIKMANEKEKNLTLDEQIMRAPIKLIREGVKLGMALSGKDVSHFDNKTVRMVSPRVMSLVPQDEEEEKDTINVLSPSLFSFYNKSSPLEQLSFPSLTQKFDEDGHQEMLNFVFEASGVSDAATYMKMISQQKEKEQFIDRLRSDAIEKKNSTFSREEITKYVGEDERKRMDRLEQLFQTFNDDQIGKLNKTGYFGMTDEQIEFLYGEESPYNNSQSLTMYKNITEEQTNEAVENTIRKLAKEEIAFKVQRRKDIVLSFLQFTALINDPAMASQPIILSPVMLSTLILSPAVFGVVVLSPWLFVPLILSPRILGPIILNPFAFVPVILSPLALNPIVLCPGVGLVILLSPLVLNPFILTPIALTPVILSPFALSPFIADPNVLSPIILSPFVLSPLVWSPPAVSAFVLTPYALSPVIQSDGAVFTAVLSPSWLS